jgi:hypothetical protein
MEKEGAINKNRNIKNKDFLITLFTDITIIGNYKYLNNFENRKLAIPLFLFSPQVF